MEVLKDAITKYESPYGHVAQLDKVAFARCECVDADVNSVQKFRSVLRMVEDWWSGFGRSNVFS